MSGERTKKEIPSACVRRSVATEWAESIKELSDLSSFKPEDDSTLFKVEEDDDEEEEEEEPPLKEFERDQPIIGSIEYYK